MDLVGSYFNLVWKNGLEKGRGGEVDRDEDIPWFSQQAINSIAHKSNYLGYCIIVKAIVTGT